MDDVTQALLGALTSQAIARKKLSYYALVMGAIAGVIGDLDILIRSSNPMTLFIYHRQFSHSLLAVLIGGCLIAAVFLLFVPKLRPHWLIAMIASVAAYGTHIFLDVCTSYGTQIYWPWSDERVTLNILPIVDPLITLVLLVGLIFVLRKMTVWRSVVPIACVGIYILFATFQHHRAWIALQKTLPATVSRPEVIPTIGQVYIWHAIYQYQGKIFFSVINTPYLSKPYFHNQQVFALFAKKDLPTWLLTQPNVLKDFETFSWFSKTYLTRIPSHGLVIVDVRFITALQPTIFLWGIRFSQDENQNHPQFLSRVRVGS